MSRRSSHPIAARGPAATLTALAVVVLVLAAGCGGSDDSATSATASTAPPSTTPSSTTAAGGGTGAEAGAAGATTVPAKGSAGCGTPADPAPKATKLGDDVGPSITYGGVERGYRLGVPVGYDPDSPTPVVFNLHGLGSNAIEQTVYSGIPKAAVERGWIAVTPESVGGPWKVGKDGDGAFLEAVLDDVEANYCVDTTRVYSTGMSMGALMSALIACGAPDRFAAIGLVTVEFKPGTCEPVPVMVFHGTADPVVPYQAGGKVVAGGFTGTEVKGTMANMEAWAKLDGCDAQPETEAVGDDVQRASWPACAGGNQVVLYTVDEGGHTWPGSKIELPFGKTTHTVDATELILDFFARHQLDA